MSPHQGGASCLCYKAGMVWQNVLGPSYPSPAVEQHAPSLTGLQHRAEGVPQAAIPRPKPEQRKGYPVLSPILKTPSPPYSKGKEEQGPCRSNTICGPSWAGNMPARLGWNHRREEPDNEPRHMLPHRGGASCLCCKADMVAGIMSWSQVNPVQQ